MFGLLNVMKPSGITSRAAVDRVHAVVRPAKVGHAGTLDPLASGVLVMAVGSATRLVRYVQQMAKQYDASFLFGYESDTEDTAGHLVRLPGRREPTRDEVEGVLSGFRGEILQRPPAYSALKVKGRRAYTLARAGRSVELAPRVVTIHDLQLLEYQYPLLRMEINCSSGTYIRSLGRDIAARLGTMAVMAALTRTSVGGFSVKEAVRLETLDVEGVAAHLLPATRATEVLPQTRLTQDQVDCIRKGMKVELAGQWLGQEVAALDGRGQLVAILAPRGTHWWGPICNL